MDTPPTTSTSLKQHVWATLSLAGPIVMARAGWMILSLVDILMVGRYSTADLAYLSLASSVISVAFVSMMGMMMGTLVISSNLYGEGRLSEIGAVWRRSLPMAVLLGFTVLALTLCAEPLLLWTGQDAIIAHETGRVMLIYGYGMPLGGLVYVTSQYFLEGIKRPVPAMVLMIVANLINIPLNWLFIYGHGGFEPMGAAGAAWSTAIIRNLLAAGIVYYIWTMADARALGLREKYTAGFHAWAEQRRLGYATGLSFGIEHVSFVMLFIFAGLLGTLDLAAVTIVFNTFAVFFMTASGIASATAVRVGIAWGEQNFRNINVAGWTGWLVQASILLVPTLLMIFTPQIFARIYSDDPALIALAIPLYVLGGFSLLLDTSQTLWSNALRARHDKWFATASHFLAYVGLMIPLSWYLAFELGHRGAGLFEALIAASVVSVVALTGRFMWLSAADKKRLSALPPAKNAT